MKTSSCLEINFFQKNKDFYLKNPVEIKLTLQKNGNYSVSNFNAYEFLNDITTGWLKVHTRLQNPEYSRKSFDEFLARNKKKCMGLENYNAFSQTEFREDTSSIFLDSIEMESNISDDKNDISLDLETSEIQHFSKNDENQKKFV